MQGGRQPHGSNVWGGAARSRVVLCCGDFAGINKQCKRARAIYAPIDAADEANAVWDLGEYRSCIID